MANRDNHYEAAFESFLRERRLAYVAVDEAKRSRLPGMTLKSLDFIVSRPRGPSWLIDVKGRRFPAGKGRQFWKNWSTRDDLRSLLTWEGYFGEGFQGILVFAYLIVGDLAPVPAAQLFEFRDALYGFVAIRRTHYAAYARCISPKWDTLAMPTARFRELAQPFETLV